MQLVFGFDRWDRIVKFENNFNGFSFRRRRHSKNWTKKMLLSSSICCWQRGRLWSCGLSVCQQSLHTIYTEICTNIHTHTFEWEFSVYRLLRNRLGALTFSSGSFGMVFLAIKALCFLRHTSMRQIWIESSLIMGPSRKKLQSYHQIVSQFVL